MPVCLLFPFLGPIVSHLEVIGERAKRKLRQRLFIKDALVGRLMVVVVRKLATRTGELWGFHASTVTARLDRKIILKEHFTYSI